MGSDLNTPTGDTSATPTHTENEVVTSTVSSKSLRTFIIFAVVFLIFVAAIIGYRFFGAMLPNDLFNLGSLPSGLIPDVLEEQKEVLKDIPAEEDISMRYATNTEPYEDRLERLYIALQTSGNTDIPAYTETTGKLAVLTWNNPRPDVQLKEGEPLVADGTYSIPKDWFGFITVHENGVVVGRQVIDNRGKDDVTAAFSISLGNFTRVHKDVRITIEGMASCRLACSPKDEECRTQNLLYCGTDTSKEELLWYNGRLFLYSVSQPSN